MDLCATLTFGLWPNLHVINVPARTSGSSLWEVRFSARGCKIEISVTFCPLRRPLPIIANRLFAACTVKRAFINYLTRSKWHVSALIAKASEWFIRVNNFGKLCARGTLYRWRARSRNLTYLPGCKWYVTKRHVEARLNLTKAVT